MRVTKQQLIGSIISMMLCHCVIMSHASLMQVDPTKSSITFTATQFLGKKVEGKFEGYSISIKLKDSSTIERIEAMIDVNSINTKNKIRDRHLRQRKFFNYKDHDYITFMATGPILLTDKYVKGKLSIKGIVKEIEVPVEFKFLQSNKNGQYVLSSKIQALQINRNDFKVDAWSLLIDSIIDINIDLISRIYIQM